MLLTSPLVATLGLSLTIPAALFFDMIVHGKHFSIYYLLGGALVLVGFVLATVSDQRDQRAQHALVEQQLHAEAEPGEGEALNERERAAESAAVALLEAQAQGDDAQAQGR